MQISKTYLDKYPHLEELMETLQVHNETTNKTFDIEKFKQLVTHSYNISGYDDINLTRLISYEKYSHGRVLFSTFAVRVENQINVKVAN